MLGCQHRYNIFAAGGLSLAGAIGLTLESYLNQKGQSFCHTTACEVVGQFIKIPESILISSGAILFWALTLSFFFNWRYPKRFSFFPFLFLTPALIFDASLIGYQFFTIEKFCIICFLTAGLLLLVTISFLFSKKTWQLCLILILAWGGAFASQSIVQMPEQTNTFARMLLFKEAVPKNDGQAKIKTATLIFSMECPHCLKLIKFLSEHEIPSTRFQIASVDQAPESLRKISTFLQNINRRDNIFKTLLESKTHPAPPGNHNLKIIKKANRKAVSFLAHNGIHSIPVIIIDTKNNEKRIFTSSNAAIKYFLEQNKKHEPSS